ncbi:hypothetical protein SDC9_34999 [bioreactor metagenome]|uniref:Uncharacterized protein n=1 Tax=bioreactor metagenome TaxID=1076179 RepID=A0A644VC91_9ZZZZ|nr:hypothetical protein [Methanocorpusculum sp.]
MIEQTKKIQLSAIIIAIIYFLPVSVWLLYILVTQYYYPAISGSLAPVFLFGTSLLAVLTVSLLLLPFAGAIQGLRLHTLQKLPGILIITAVVLILGISVCLMVIGNPRSFGEALRLFSIDLFFISLIFTPLYCPAAFMLRVPSSKKAVSAKISGICLSIAGLGMTYVYFWVSRSVQQYDTSLHLINDIWYYSIWVLLIGFGIWAVIGVITGILTLASLKNRDEGQ